MKQTFVVAAGSEYVLLLQHVFTMWQAYLHKYIVVLKHVPELFRRRSNTKGTLPTGSSWSEDRSKAFLGARQVLHWIHNIVAQFCIHLESASWDILFMGWNNVDSHIYASNWNPLIWELIPPWQGSSWSEGKTFWATATDFMALYAYIPTKLHLNLFN